jgi:hypothetical protein
MAGIVTKIRRAVTPHIQVICVVASADDVRYVQLTKYVPSIVHVALFVAVESNNGTWSRLFKHKCQCLLFLRDVFGCCVQSIDLHVISSAASFLHNIRVRLVQRTSH